jgi:hypothetical protein
MPRRERPERGVACLAGAGQEVGMNGVVTLFRVAGIPVRVHASWLVIFGLIAWSLSVGYFPHVLPDFPRLPAHPPTRSPPRSDVEATTARAVGIRPPPSRRGARGPATLYGPLLARPRLVRAMGASLPNVFLRDAWAAFQARVGHDDRDGGGCSRSVRCFSEPTWRSSSKPGGIPDRRFIGRRAIPPKH